MRLWLPNRPKLIATTGVQTGQQANVTLGPMPQSFTYLSLYAILLASAATGVASAQSAAQCFTGYGYHPSSDTLAFTARYNAVGEAASTREQWQVVYRGPGDKIIARKHMDFSYNPFLPVYSEQFKTSGNATGIRRNTQGHWQMFKRQGSDGKVQSTAFDVAPLMVGNNGIHPFIQANFKQLMAHKTLRFKLVLAPRQKVINMRLDRIGDTQINGESAVRFRAKVDSFFIGLFTQKLIFTYNPADKQLLAYRGVSDIQADNDKPYPVYVRYFQGKPPASVQSPALPACGGG